MFNHLAPVGLAQRSNAEKSQHQGIEEDIVLAVRDIIENSCVGSNFTYNLSHPDTKALLRSFDKFFAHGLIRNDKCYWCFIREFLPSIEQQELKNRWNASKTRSLSLAWLRDSLNKSNLYFQMLAFISCSDKIKRIYYTRNASMINKPMLKRVTLLADRLSDLNFFIEAPFVLCSEDTPIAVVPIAQFPAHSPCSTDWQSPILAYSPPRPVNCRSHIDSTRSRISISDQARTNFYISSSYTSASVSSFLDNSGDPYLNSLVQDLSEVVVPSFTNEPFLSSVKEQEFAFEELLRNHSKKMNNLVVEEMDQENDGNQKLKDRDRRYSSKESQVTEEYCIKDDDDKTPIVESRPFPKRDIDVSDNETLLDEIIVSPRLNIFSLPRESVSKNSADKTAFSNIETEKPSNGEVDFPGGILVDGEVLLDSGEIVHLAMEVFKQNGERFQRLFQVYTGHASGNPQIRFLLLTNQFTYLLSLSVTDVDNVATATEVLPFEDKMSQKSSPQSHFLLDDDVGRTTRPRYNVISSFPIDSINCISIGSDAQTICFKLSNCKVQASENSTHEIRQLLVETASEDLGKSIASAFDKALHIYQQQMFAEKRLKTSDRPPITVMSHSNVSFQNASPSSSYGFRRQSCPHQQQFTTESDFFLTTFIQRELKQPDAELAFHSLVYWHQNSDTFSERNKASNSVLEGFLYFREQQKLWTRKYSDWEPAFFVLQGKMLYQFSDSTCKFAVRSLNIRNAEQVFSVDLKNDAKYVFELTLNSDSSENFNISQPISLQFQCTSNEIVQKWINALSLALSISNESLLPVACSLCITAKKDFVVAQEGSNYQIDGFMRGLNFFNCDEIDEVWTVRTDVHHTIVIKKKKKPAEWFFFRDTNELDRLVKLLGEQWSLPIEDGIGYTENEEAVHILMQLSATCARIPDLWNAMCA